VLFLFDAAREHVLFSHFNGFQSDEVSSNKLYKLNIVGANE
jgi:hypothetical protein